MTKLIRGIFCLALVMTLVFSVGYAEQTEVADIDYFVVGSLTQLSGGFFTDCWGNNTADVDVRAMLHGLSTVAMLPEGDYGIDPSVCEATYVDLPNGDRTYTFTINDNLVYSDGAPITARDYVFSALLVSCPQIVEIGGQNMDLSHLVGHSAYAAGEAEVFSGVRLLGERSFSLTILAANLPYFYELVMVSINPYPISVILPNCDVYDDGEGAYIAPIPETDGEFSAEVLALTLLDPETGYRTHPSVVSGPYTLVSYENNVARFKINENYIGNYEGMKPTIDNIEYRQIINEDIIPAIESGEFDIVNKISSAEVINAGLQLTETARATTYLRAGLSFLAFACENQPVSSLAVRQAVMSLVDIDTLCNEYLISFGLPVYGYYGFGQMMPVQVQEELYQFELYPFDIDAAREILIADGWTLNAEGLAYNAEVDTLRHKLVDGELLPLIITWVRPETSEIADYIQAMLEENTALVGMVIEPVPMLYEQLATYYYRQADRSEYDMFFLGTNFNLVFDPYPTFSTEAAFQGVYNTTAIADEALMATAKDLNKTEGGDVETYMTKWWTFQQAFVEALPLAPLYSNVYCDLYDPLLLDYNVNVNWSWASAILYAHY